MYHSKKNPRKGAAMLANIVCLLLLANTASAAVPAIDAAYDLNQLIAAAKTHSPELESLRSQVEVGLVKEANIPWWDTPEVRLGYGRDSNVSSDLRSSEYPNHDYDAAVRVYPKSPWERKATLKKLQSESHLNSLMVQQSEQELTHAIKACYWNFSYLTAEAALHKQLLAIYEDQAQGMETLLKNGQITLSQNLPVKMKQLDANLRMDDYNNALSGLRHQLVQLTGVQLSFIRAANTRKLNAADFDLAYETWIQYALENRIELKQYDDGITHTQAELDELHAQNLPWIKHLQANYEVRNDYGDQDSAGIEIAITLPFLTSDGGAKRAALTTLSSQHRQRGYSAGRIRSEVRALVNQFHALKEDWISLQQNMAPLTVDLKESIKLMQQQHLQSTRNYWDAQIALLEISKKELEIAHSYQDLLLKAEQVLGESPTLAQIDSLIEAWHAGTLP
jgi:outer membrane protein TolC